MRQTGNLFKWSPWVLSGTTWNLLETMFFEGKDANESSNKTMKALKGDATLHVTTSQAEKTEMVDKAINVIVLCLEDKVLKEIVKETIAAPMWSRLESLYMTKLLAHRQFLNKNSIPLEWWSQKLPQSNWLSSTIFYFFVWFCEYWSEHRGRRHGYTLIMYIT